MLKRLELVGFKSFADKTQFDFPGGITAIVGPNGSGKSNVVDAVRWILGEQSAKSLRGGEMADVIFNGSTSRRSLGLAEVTMTFDNGRRLLPTDASEVQITRRVYRSGEGEYLINQQICRLKDIKEMFLGSGAGTDAYSIIEQGRVDVLLQASTRDRRVIFEEAAGISRFKAKKLETLRKLERVEQNLQRLRDIIDEVEKQLRSVKLQAAKAQRYQEYSLRLKELRISLGLEEYHQLNERLEAETAVLQGMKGELEKQALQLQAWEAESAELDENLGRLDEAVHEQETLLANARQQIATEETTLGHEWSLSTDLETELASTRVRLTELNARVATLAETAAKAAEELSGVELQGQEQSHHVEALEHDLNAIVQRLADLHKQIKDDQAEHLEQMRRAARLHNDAVQTQARVDNLCRERDRLLHKTERAAEHLALLDLELQELSQAEDELQARLAGARQGLADQRQERERLRRLREEASQNAADLRAQRTGVASRIEVLERLERSHEGLSTGVRELMTLLGEDRHKRTCSAGDEQSDCERENGSAGSVPRSPSFSDVVLGMIADFLTVRREFAPLIDLALGDRAQRFLVRDAARLAELLQSRPEPFSGRISFFPLTAATRSENGSNGRSNRLIDLSHAVRMRVPVSPAGTPIYPGMIAPADQLVTCEDPNLAGLPAQLLGQTLIVRDLDTARAMAEHTSGYRFVTLEGELLEPDGTLTVGAHHAETGILSRKSELRELRSLAAELDQRIADTERDVADLRDRLASHDNQMVSLQENIEVLAEQSTDLRTRIGQRRERREGLHEEVTISRSEIGTVERDIRELEASWQQAKSQAEEADRLVQTLQTRKEEADREIRDREHERHERQRAFTTAHVALAKIEERLTALRAQHHQLQSDLEERQQECHQSEDHLSAGRRRLEESQRSMLQAAASLADYYLQKEIAERRVAELSAEREERRRERHGLAERTQAARTACRTQQEQAHAHELEVSDLRHRRDTLCQRLREDYQVELAELYQHRTAAKSPESAAGAAAANEEIEELRRKLSRLGSVNLDSLQELAELENRSATLQTQSDDLTAAKRSLEEIIATINQDSRRLFTETFGSIRTHFQELFRKLFGGGMADIVLEDDMDILESGIEIIARPPGKELRSISLMSGGEKTLTAVALLLAIFRSKPSPFCILDEVDAALDEANIGRFTAVLRDFLDQSQFIIITHSKRTMAVADVLYGITMQESGVSKRVAVRFEDWEEGAHKHANGSQTNGAASPAGIGANDRN
jgi:chromosome segregation protein